jgi:hypothetical protein
MRRVLCLSVVASVFVTAPAFAQRFNPRSTVMTTPFSGPSTFLSGKFRTVPGMTSPVMPSTGVPATGNFVLGAQGNFSPKNLSFAPGASGNSFLTGQGFFVPTNGTFIPDGNGNFVLTIRASLNPTTGTFSPSATGNFFFPTRGDLISTTTGSPVITITPFSPLVPLASLASLPLTGTYSANPYAYSPASAGAAMNPYSYASTGAYGSNPYVPYSMPYQPTSASAAPSSFTGAVSSAAVASAQSAPAAYGIPIEKGHIKWPLAFRLLPPETKENVADRLEGELVSIASQAAGGAPNTGLVADAKRNVARLAAWLKSHQDDMAEATYQEGRAFVRLLDEALTAVRY